MQDGRNDLPTLIPPNEWVEALEAINNAAVAYIEGGPYENDLPGMELAVEIDRLSRDFVRPPNEPLTLEQMIILHQCQGLVERIRAEKVKRLQERLEKRTGRTATDAPGQRREKVGLP